MSDRGLDEIHPFEVTATASLKGRRGEGWVMHVILENGAEADGGDVELLVTDVAKRSYGLSTCVDEFERWLNATFRPEYRLDAAVAMAEAGAFVIDATPVTGPQVVLPPERTVPALAA